MTPLTNNPAHPSPDRPGIPTIPPAGAEASLRRMARLSVWDIADRIGEVCGPGEPRAIERAQAVQAIPYRLRRGGSVWSDCPLCSLDVNACLCDPDDYAAAVRANQGAL